MNKWEKKHRQQNPDPGSPPMPTPTQTELSPAAIERLLDAPDVELRELADRTTDPVLADKLRGLANYPRTRARFEIGAGPGWLVNFLKDLEPAMVAVLEALLASQPAAAGPAKPAVPDVSVGTTAEH